MMQWGNRGGKKTRVILAYLEGRHGGGAKYRTKSAALKANTKRAGAEAGDPNYKKKQVLVQEPTWPTVPGSQHRRGGEKKGRVGNPRHLGE